MLRRLPAQDASVEPTPKFASAVEIETAAVLRRQLEQRYFEASASPLPSHPPAEVVDPISRRTARPVQADDYGGRARKTHKGSTTRGLG